MEIKLPKDKKDIDKLLKEIDSEILRIQTQLITVQNLKNKIEEEIEDAENKKLPEKTS